MVGMEMPTLNTVFNHKSNSLCNNSLFSSLRMPDMHKQMERLYEAAKAIKGITGQSELARALNASPQTVKNWEARGVSKSGLLTAERTLGCSAVWVETGNGQMLTKKGVVEVDEHSDFKAIKRVKFKLSAGISGYEIEYLNGHRAPIFFRRDWLEARNLNADNLFAVEVSGASMETSLFEGDVVVVNTADTAPRDGHVFAANYEGELVVKRLIRNGGEWFLSSDNQDKRRYPDKLCDERTFLIGIVVHKQSERI